MARDLVDALDVDRRADATTATIVQRVTRPARLLTAAEIAGSIGPVRPARDELELLLVLDQPTADGYRVRGDGPVGATTAPQLHAELQRRTQGKAALGR
jgi:hypothetical protein